MVGFNSATLPPYSLQGNRKYSSRLEPGGRPSDAEEKPREPVSSKVGRASETLGAIQIHPHKARITRARDPRLPIPQIRKKKLFIYKIYFSFAVLP